MQQTFRRTIEGQLIQFNRLLFPLRYALKLDDEGSSGETIILKQGLGAWHLSDKEPPDWFNQTVRGIIEAINDNEFEE